MDVVTAEAAIVAAAVTASSGVLIDSARNQHLSLALFVIHQYLEIFSGQRLPRPMANMKNLNKARCGSFIID